VKLPKLFLVVGLLWVAFPLAAQDTASDSRATLRINSRAVLLDVIVTDHKGVPVTGLKQGQEKAGISRTSYKRLQQLLSIRYPARRKCAAPRCSQYTISGSNGCAQGSR